MAGTPRPNIVVGIDVGQTCSGVAYSIGPDWSEPRNLNRWPSHDGIEKADKVATRVGYSKTRDTLLNWGFQSVFRDDNIIVREQFKLTLDADYEDDRGINSEEARRWYLDYLRCLYHEIEKFFDASVPRWRTLNVEYSFSTPTTWKNPAMIASIEKLIKAAGFTGTRQQTVRMALTEAEAAAIEASTTQYRQGDIFLICDAGGGTTDVNVLQVKSADKKIELEPLDHVEGVAVGSTLIDFRMSQHIVERLLLVEGYLDGDPYCLADEMLMDRFQTVKHSFPNPAVDEFWLDVKGLAGSHTFPEAGIKNSRMSISRKVLKDIFDQQLEKIFELMDGRLVGLRNEFPDKQVSYIILSGGLGSSPYLYEQIKNRYEMNMGFHSTNTETIRVMKVLEPQLAVVRGLVRERTQQLAVSTVDSGEVFATRRCRNSYGVVLRIPYDEFKHQGLPFMTDPIDNRRWVENIVDWFIRQGQVVRAEEGIRRSYGATIAEGEQTQPRLVHIVMSTFPPHQLPRIASQAGCQKVASVQYRLTGNDMKLKNRQLWKLKKKYWKADFIFVVKLGPADLRFQILGRQGLLSSDHDSLQIHFMDPLELKASGTVQNKQKPTIVIQNLTGGLVEYSDDFPPPLPRKSD